tara:strand:+ start:2851 stop:3192 length:342 start_codon:yes stop_codon:yes gene_type:complete
MKKTILFIFLILPVFVFAQEPTKNQIKNAEKITNYVAEKHSLSKKDKKIFYDATLNQIVTNAAEIKRQGITDAEAKKVVYRKGYNNIKETLSKKFGNQKAIALLKSGNEARRQ